MQTKRRVLAAKIETTEGTPETLTTDDTGLLITEPSYAPDISMLPRNVLLASFSKLPDLTGQQLSKLSFKAEVIGRGVAYAAATLPRLDPYLRACGLVPTVDETVSAEKVSYQRASDNIPSLTLAFLDADDEGGAVIKKIAGARGNVKFTGEVGGPLYAAFEFTGAYQAVTAGEQLAANIDSVLPPQLLSAAFSVGGYAPALQSFEIDMGNTLAGRPDMNAASGYRSFMITDGDTRGSFDPEMVKVATKDYYGDWVSGLSGALQIGAFGPAQYNRVQLTAPKLRTTNVQEGEREGQMTLDVSFQLAMDTGDDEFVLEFS